MPNGQKLTRVFIPGGGIQIRTNGELSPLYIGWADVPDDVLYTLQLMPAYAATDAQGRPLSDSLAAASFGDKGPVAQSSMPAPDTSYARGEAFNTDVADADARGLHSQAAIDAARSGERTGTESLLEQVAQLKPGDEVRSPVKGQQELSFTQRRQIRDEVRRLQVSHDHAIAAGQAEEGTRPALVTEESEQIADDFDDEFGGGDDSGGDLSKVIEQHQAASDGAGVSGVAGQETGGSGGARRSRSRKGAGARKRSAAKRGRKRAPRSSTSDTDAE
jgi:hypothetical protein